MATPAAATGFRVETSSRSLGYNPPQRMGRALWLPMFLGALMLFGTGMIVGIVRANEIADGGAADTIATLQHVQAGFMFLGFAAVFSAISFAIARILGQFRAGGGEVQKAARRTVQTLRMPVTAKLFLMLMMAALATLVVASILHFVFAADIQNTPTSLADAEERFIVLEGVRRTGVAVFLFGILLGLATVVRVLRFQATRLRRLPEEPQISQRSEGR
jgi:formate hydrogenlyase subunit 3/multisubunit Na+/H+ antiporter MnhD subunit